MRFSWFSKSHAVVLEWRQAIFHIEDNSAVKQWKSACRNRSGQPWIIVWIAITIAVVALLTAPTAWYILQHLSGLNPPLPGSQGSTGSGLLSLFRPGLSSFRTAIAMAYLPWLAYAVYCAVATAYSALSVANEQSADSHLLSELRHTPLAHADFVVAVLRIALPRLYITIIVGAVVLGSILISLNEQLPGELWQYDSSLSPANIIVLALFVCLGGWLGSTILILTYLALGRGTSSWQFMHLIAAFVTIAQLLWLGVLFSDYGLVWNTGDWRWTNPAEELLAILSFVCGLALLMWLTLRCAATLVALRKVAALAVLGFPLSAYAASYYLGNAFEYYAGMLDSKWQTALAACPQLAACPFALINTAGDWPTLSWEYARLDFEYYSNWLDFASVAPYFAYLGIQLTILVIVAHFARDAVKRWRHEEP